MANVFIHIPKTGGLSLVTGLRGADFIRVKHNLRDLNYLHPSLICKKDDYVFTFVRNPYTRLLSSFHYLQHGGNRPEDEDDANALGLKDMKLDEFVIHHLAEAAQWQIHFLPQSFFLENVDKPDIYYFEQLPKSFSRLLKRFDLPERRLPHLNALDYDRDIFKRFAPEATAVIRKVYHQDFKSFAYPELPDIRRRSFFSLSSYFFQQSQIHFK